MSTNNKPDLEETRQPDEVRVGPNTAGTAGIFRAKGKPFEVLAWEQDEQIVVFYEAEMEAEYPTQQAKVQALNAIRQALAGQTGKRVIFRAQ